MIGSGCGGEAVDAYSIGIVIVDMQPPVPAASDLDDGASTVGAAQIGVVIGQPGDHRSYCYAIKRTSQ